MDRTPRRLLAAMSTELLAQHLGSALRAALRVSPLRVSTRAAVRAAFDAWLKVHITISPCHIGEREQHDQEHAAGELDAGLTGFVAQRAQCGFSCGFGAGVGVHAWLGGSDSSSTDVTAFELTRHGVLTPGMNNGTLSETLTVTASVLSIVASFFHRRDRGLGDLPVRELLRPSVGSTASLRAPSRAAWPASTYV
jgi:hypothetical protein